MSEEVRGSSGGAARAAKLTKEERSRIAKEAAQRRWNKAKESLEKAADAGIPAEINEPAGDIYPTYGGLDRTPPTVPEPPKDNHCHACSSGQNIEKGEGTHVLGTLKHPFHSTLTQIVDTPPVLVDPTPVPLPKPPKRQPKPMPKEFKGASQYAEKRLPQAIKEKSEHVGAVAKLDAEINDLVRVIKALGGHVDPQFNQPIYAAQNPYQPNFSQGYPSAPSAVMTPQNDPGIDPALFQANMGPTPANAPMPQVPIIPNTSLGGAMDLDYQPREEEENNKLPSMGGGWV